MAVVVQGRVTLLHRALQLDAVASGVLGALLAVTSGATGRLLDLPAALLLDAGIVMLAWAAITGWLGTRAVVPRRGAVAAIVVNLLWAIDSVALLVTGWVEPNGLGVAFVVVQALAVLGLAELQYQGLRRRHT
jgi:CHASE2 domain-containing sensor protein